MSGFCVCFVQEIQGVVFSVSTVNSSFGRRELKSSRIFCMLEWLESNVRRISSIYLQ